MGLAYHTGGVLVIQVGIDRLGGWFKVGTLDVDFEEVGLRLVKGPAACGLLAMVALVSVAATAGCGAARTSSSTPPLTGSVQYSGAVFHVPAGWRLLVLPTSRGCRVLERLLSPAAVSRSPVARLKADAVGLIPLRSNGHPCVSMRDSYGGPWRSIRSSGGLTEDVSATTWTEKAFGQLGVYEWRSIPSLDIGLQLFGHGPTVNEALVVVRAIAGSASARAGDREHERASHS